VATQEFFNFGDLGADAHSFIRSRPGIGAKAHDYYTHEKTVREFAVWCIALKEFFDAIDEYVRTPDLFLEASKPGSPLNALVASSKGENFAISDQERPLVLSRINELETYIQEQSAPEGEEAARLAAEMEYLREASARLGRKDWLNVLISVLVALDDRSVDTYTIRTFLWQNGLCHSSRKDHA